MAGSKQNLLKVPTMAGTRKGSTRLSPESEAEYRAINLRFDDLRHEGGSRLLEGGWPVHHVQHMLGHASPSANQHVSQRDAPRPTRIDAESRSIRPACKQVHPAASGLFASWLPQ
jgi:integrase